MRPYEDIDLAAKSPGTVKWVVPKEGDRIKKGEKLLELNMESVATRVTEARARYNQAAKDYDRMKKLYEEQIVSKMQLDNARTTLDTSKAALDAFTTCFHYEMEGKGRLLTVYPVATQTAFFNTAGGADTPQVWPTQEPDVVARAIVKGILKNKRVVWPSRLSLLIRMCHIAPVLLQMTIRFEQWKFKRWAKRQEK